MMPASQWPTAIPNFMLLTLAERTIVLRGMDSIARGLHRIGITVLEDDSEMPVMEEFAKLILKSRGAPIAGPDTKPITLFEIWAEGFAATGDRGTAQKMGVAEGDTFEQACANLARRKSDFAAYFKPTPVPTYWGCRLYDNEKDARKSFG